MSNLEFSVTPSNKVIFHFRYVYYRDFFACVGITKGKAGLALRPVLHRERGKTTLVPKVF